MNYPGTALGFFPVTIGGIGLLDFVREDHVGGTRYSIFLFLLGHVWLNRLRVNTSFFSTGAASYPKKPGIGCRESTKGLDTFVR